MPGMLEAIDEFVGSVCAWGKDYFWLTITCIVRPKSVWRELKLKSYDGKLHLKAFGMLAFGILVLDTMQAIHSGDLELSAGESVTEYVGHLTEGMVFTLHLLVGSVLIVVSSALLRWAGRVPV